MVMATTHGIISRYNKGCRCDECRACARGVRRRHRAAAGTRQVENARRLLADLPPVPRVRIKPVKQRPSPRRHVCSWRTVGSEVIGGKAFRIDTTCCGLRRACTPDGPACLPMSRQAVA